MVAALPPVAITNVTVVDVVGGQLLPGRTVVTMGETIAGVSEDAVIPDDAVRVDGTGRYLIPGLWDMHAHHEVAGEEQADLFVANGVTGTRDMGAQPDLILSLRDRIARRDVLGPEIVAAGPILDAGPAEWPRRRRVTNAREAREAVRELAEQGVDFIKVHDRTPVDAFRAIAQVTPAVGLTFSGHVPIGITIAEAATSGMRSIEHLSNYQVFLECAGDASYSLELCTPLFDSLAANGVWQTPTIAFFQSIPPQAAGEPLPDAEYASDSLLALNAGNVEAFATEEVVAFFRDNAPVALDAIADLHARGSVFLAGCDGLVPGFCLHDELHWFVEAGFSPLDALRTATLNPARFLERDDSQGAVAAGMRADLVLLDADPLADIAATRRIAAVVVRGQLLQRPELDAILSAHRRPPAP
jgi:imidazolonepropionase-like amidohydrolase